MDNNEFQKNIILQQQETIKHLIHRKNLENRLNTLERKNLCLNQSVLFIKKQVNKSSKNIEAILNRIKDLEREFQFEKEEDIFSNVNETTLLDYRVSETTLLDYNESIDTQENSQIPEHRKTESENENSTN